MGAARNFLPDDWSVERSPQPLEAEWRALEAEAIGTPFQSYDWVRLYHELQGQDAVFAAGRRAGVLKIVFPLALNSGVLTWFGEALNNYNAPLVAQDLHAALTPGDVNAMWHSVRAAVGHPAASILRRQPVEIAGTPNPFAQWSAVTEPTSSYALKLGSNWPDFYEAMHTAATRKTQRKKERALAKNGETSMRRIEGRDAIFASAHKLLAWKSDQVDACGGRNNFANAANREIIARYAAEHLDTVRMYVLAQSGIPLALAYRIANGAQPILYQMAYAPGPAARHSPGRLLLNHVIADSIADKLDVLDFAVGDEPYKQDICDLVLQMTTSLMAHSGAGRIVVAKERLTLGLKGTIKSIPFLRGALKKIGV